MEEELEETLYDLTVYSVTEEEREKILEFIEEEIGTLDSQSMISGG